MTCDDCPEPCLGYSSHRHRKHTCQCVACKELHYVAPDREESKLEVETSAGKLEKPAAKGKAAAKTATDGQPQSCALSGMPESVKYQT